MVLDAQRVWHVGPTISLSRPGNKISELVGTIARYGHESAGLNSAKTPLGFSSATQTCRS
jgi:hypothetical protein